MDRYESDDKTQDPAEELTQTRKRRKITKGIRLLWVILCNACGIEVWVHVIGACADYRDADRAIPFCRRCAA